MKIERMTRKDLEKRSDSWYRKPHQISAHGNLSISDIQYFAKRTVGALGDKDKTFWPHDKNGTDQWAKNLSLDIERFGYSIDPLVQVNQLVTREKKNSNEGSKDDMMRVIKEGDPRRYNQLYQYLRRQGIKSPADFLRDQMNNFRMTSGYETEGTIDLTREALGGKKGGKSMFKYLTVYYSWSRHEGSVEWKL